NLMRSFSLALHSRYARWHARKAQTNNIRWLLCQEPLDDIGGDMPLEHVAIELDHVAALQGWRHASLLAYLRVVGDRHDVYVDAIFTKVFRVRLAALAALVLIECPAKVFGNHGTGCAGKYQQGEQDMLHWGYPPSWLVFLMSH